MRYLFLPLFACVLGAFSGWYLAQPTKPEPVHFGDSTPAHVTADPNTFNDPNAWMTWWLLSQSLVNNRPYASPFAFGSFGRPTDAALAPFGIKEPEAPTEDEENTLRTQEEEEPAAAPSEEEDDMGASDEGESSYSGGAGDEDE